MPVPLALAAPAAAAGLAYLNARTALGYDYRVYGSGIKGSIICSIREKKDRLNAFYLLEGYALGKQANDVFLIYDGRQWTYKELYRIALSYGTWLKNTYNIQRNDIVAIDFTNNEKFVFLWFGLWAIGAKPAFINYNLSGKALAHCIQVSTARLTLIDPEVEGNFTHELRDGLSKVEFKVLTPEVEAEIVSTEGVREPDSSRSEDLSQNTAALIFTSGTTGLPKAAIVSWTKATIGPILAKNFMSLRKSDIFYTSMPLYHASASILGLLVVLNTGATIHVGKKFSTKLFWQDCRSSNATVIQYVGETCRYLLAAPPQLDPKTGENLDKANSVRMAFGNGLRPDVWNRFKERFGIEAIAEFYSATEGSSASWNYSKNDFSKGAIGRHGSIGKIILGKAWAPVVLDWETEAPWRDPITGFCQRVKPGEPGEMLFKLDETNIAKGFQGYFNNKKSTDSKIMRDVFVKGDAYFRTGDLMIWDAHGRVYFNDRIGDTFRWKGENVSTNEVSELLGSHPAVQEANVYGVEIPHHDGRAGCVAIVLAEEPHERLLSSLADHARKSLPRFAVPLFLRLMKDMQITGTNKQQKHVVRTQGVNPAKTGDDDLYWLKGGTYVKFSRKDWEELNGGRVRL